MPDTKTIPRPKILPADPVAQTEPGWKVLLYNDDVHTVYEVIFAVQRAAGLSLEVAQMIVMEADASGMAVVKRGLEEEDALIICGGLRRWTRSAHQPPVDCEAVKDDA